MHEHVVLCAISRWLWFKLGVISHQSFNIIIDWVNGCYKSRKEQRTLYMCMHKHFSIGLPIDRPTDPQTIRLASVYACFLLFTNSVISVITMAKNNKYTLSQQDGKRPFNILFENVTCVALLLLHRGKLTAFKYSFTLCLSVFVFFFCFDSFVKFENLRGRQTFQQSSQFNRSLSVSQFNSIHSL